MAIYDLIGPEQEAKKTDGVIEARTRRSKDPRTIGEAKRSIDHFGTTRFKNVFKGTNSQDAAQATWPSLDGISKRCCKDLKAKER